MTPADPIQQLVHQLSRLPGVGRKSATRLSYFLLSESTGYADRLAGAILDAREKVKNCSVCGNLTEQDPCPLCSDYRRDSSILCVVEQVPDLLAVEATGEFRGHYHILNGAISPLNGIGPENLRISELLQRAKEDEIGEIILATSPTVDGNATALYIQKLLKTSGVTVSRIASGIPVGSDLEYLDRETISRALAGRQILE